MIRTFRLGTASVCIFLAVILASAFETANACASCGSGGDDPMILYPNENFKFYLGLSNSNRFRNVDSKGGFATAGGPTTKQAATVAFGKSFNLRSFATITIPHLRNVGQDTSKTSFGDPSLAYRYSLVLQDITAPAIPQVQLIAGYKHSYATSLRDSKELKTQIDVFGSGFSELKAGVDVWYGLSDIKAGFAQIFIYPIAKEYHGVRYQPGMASRQTASLGYMWYEKFKTTIGINRDQRAGIKVGGDTMKNSDQLNQSAFVTADFYPRPVCTFRLSAARQAAIGKNRNTAQFDTVTLGYMRAF